MSPFRLPKIRYPIANETKGENKMPCPYRITCEYRLGEDPREGNSVCEPSLGFSPAEDGHILCNTWDVLVKPSNKAKRQERRVALCFGHHPELAMVR